MLIILILRILFYLLNYKLNQPVFHKKNYEGSGISKKKKKLDNTIFKIFLFTSFYRFCTDIVVIFVYTFNGRNPV